MSSSDPFASRESESDQIEQNSANLVRSIEIIDERGIWLKQQIKVPDIVPRSNSNSSALNDEGSASWTLQRQQEVQEEIK